MGFRRGFTFRSAIRSESTFIRSCAVEWTSPSSPAIAAEFANLSIGTSIEYMDVCRSSRRPTQREKTEVPAKVFDPPQSLRPVLGWLSHTAPIASCVYAH